MMKLSRKEGKPAPETMESCWRGSVGHEDTAYFSMGYNVHAYTISKDKWVTLKRCKYEDFGMVVVHSKLTVVGGYHGNTTSNTLFSLTEKSKWEKVLPSMTTKRVGPAVVSIPPTHILVAGGKTSHLGVELSTVEMFNISTYQWFNVASLPKALVCPNMTLHGSNLYIAGRHMLYFANVSEILKSNGDSRASPSLTDSISLSTWTRVADIPVTYGASLATVGDYVVAVGGSDGYSNLTGLLHSYDPDTDSWSIVGEMATPRYDSQVAVLDGKDLVVVGGYEKKQGSKFTSRCRVTEIVTFNNENTLQ